MAWSGNEEGVMSCKQSHHGGSPPTDSESDGRSWK